MSARPPIVVRSYHQDEDLALQAIRMGAQDYRIKAEESGGLRARSIRYAIERNRLERRDGIEADQRLAH